MLDQMKGVITDVLTLYECSSTIGARGDWWFVDDNQ